MTHMISVGTQELLLDLFEKDVDQQVLDRLAKLSVAEQQAIEELLKEAGC